MKKMMMKYLVLTLILSTLVACTQEQPATTTNNTTVNNNGGGTGDTGGSDTGGDDGSDTGGGTGSGYALISYDIFMAGDQSWKPEPAGHPAVQFGAVPSIQEAFGFFASDSTFKVRLQVNPQEQPNSGDIGCYGRETGKSGDPKKYTMLKFNVHLRNVMCDTPNSSNSNICDSGFYLGPRYGTKRISPVTQNQYSSVLDYSYIRDKTRWGTVVEVSDVRSDSTCQYHQSGAVSVSDPDYYCPSEDYVRKASCWGMNIQIQTDYTRSF